MEPVTHLLTGACLSRLGFNRKTALATAAMVIAAEIPDIDVVVYFVDPVSGFAHHRGFTHSLIGIPFDALLTLGILKLYWSWRRRRKPLSAGRSLEAWEQPRWGLLFLFCCLATASHLLLDFTNVEYLSSVELGTLITLHKRVKAFGGRLTLFNLNAQVYEVFTVTHLQTVLGICREENAVAKVNQPIALQVCDQN